MKEQDCLTTEIKRAFLADTLSTTEREAAEAHLAACRACRHQMTMFFEEAKIETLPAPASLKEKAKQIPAQEIKEKRGFLSALAAYFRQPVAIGVSAILLIAISSIAFFVLRGSFSQNSNREIFRQGDTLTNKPQLLSPTANAQITNDKIEFRWDKVINALSYTLIIMDEKGDIISQQKTTQESFSLNASALNPVKGKPYFWFVKTKLADGTTIDSDTAKFLFVK